MAEIVAFKGTGEIGEGRALDPDAFLEANKGKFARVMLIGVDSDEKMVVCCTHGSREAMWLLRRGEHWLLEQAET